MSDTPVSSPDAQDDRAAEYVLGTLSPEAQADVARRMRTDRAFAREVYAWQDKLLPLTRRVAPMSAPESLWVRLREGLQMGRRAPAWWMRVRLWQTISALSIVLAVAMMLRVSMDPEPARYLAVLSSPENEAVWVVNLVDSETVRLQPVGEMPVVPIAMALQFWTKTRDADRPTSLGLVQAGQTLDIPRSSLPAVEAGQLFEVTLEAEGGSPTGLPTGPILAIGRMVSL